MCFRPQVTILVTVAHLCARAVTQAIVSTALEQISRALSIVLRSIHQRYAFRGSGRRRAMARNAVSPIVMAERDPSMPRYTEEQRARLMALPSAMLTATLVMGATDPVATVRDVLDEMRYFREMREAYPGNDLIQGMLQDAENPLPGLHLSSSSDREAVLHALHQYIEEASALLANDTEAKEFKAFLAALTEMVAEDVEKGQFGSDPAIEQAQMKYLRTLKQQFSLQPPKQMNGAAPSDASL